MISPTLERFLRDFNPWWEGEPGPVLPTFRRHLVQQIHRRLESRLAPIVVVRGSRQVGKTTAQRQVLDDLLARGVPARNVFRVQFDEIEALEKIADPILVLISWFERSILGKTLNRAAHDGEPTYLFFDEIQNLRSWAEQLKSLVDHSTTQVVVTGSSALRIELGRDSLAGRITTIECGVLSLTEIAGLRGLDIGGPFLPDNGIERLLRADFWRDLFVHGRVRSSERDTAFRWFSERGGYPIGHARPNVPWSQIADQLNENIVRRVIRHDLRLGERGRRRDEALLEEVFRLACRYAGQSPTLQTLRNEAGIALGAQVGDQRIRSYLKFLADSLLLRVIEPLEIRLKKRRGSPKLCLVDHALRASWLQEWVPLDPVELAKFPDLGTLAGRLVESVVGATLSTISGLDVNHLPERGGEPEIDFVLTVGDARIPIEVKYQNHIDPLRDLKGLRRFLDRPIERAPFGLLITKHEVAAELGDKVVAIPLPSFLLLR